MTVQDIITLSKAGFTAQQITQLSQPQQMGQPQMAQPQMAQQMLQPQMAQPQMPQQMLQPQMAQPQMPQQMLQPQMAQPQMPQQMVQPQVAQPQMPQQMVQPQMAQYMPVLPQTTQTDPLKDVMLQQYTNAGQNMYNMTDVVANMIGANAPVNTEKK